MANTCRHGNPLSNSCSFCKVEKKKESPGKSTPGANQRALPTLRCEQCGYSTVYGDAFRRHHCDAEVDSTAKEVAEKLLADLAKTKPKKRSKGNASASERSDLTEQRKTKHRKSRFPGIFFRRSQGKEEDRFTMAEDFLSLLCNKLEIKVPLLVFSDELQNEGACGEAGQSTIWLRRQYVLTRDWSDVQRTICHEVAHILVHNTPEMKEAPAHGAEFHATLVTVEKVWRERVK